MTIPSGLAFMFVSVIVRPYGKISFKKRLSDAYSIGRTIPAHSTSLSSRDKHTVVINFLTSSVDRKCSTQASVALNVPALLLVAAVERRE